MTIELDGFVIEQCEWNGKYTKFDLYRLHERKEGKNAGQVIRKAERYHGTIEQCLNSIVKIRIGTIGKVDQEEFLKEYQRITEIIKEDVNVIKDAFNNYVSSLD